MNPLIRVYRWFVNLKAESYRKWIRRQFRHFGDGTEIYQIDNLSHPELISLGDRVYVGHHVVLEAVTQKGGSCFTPEIIVGDGTRIGDYCHLGAIRFIHIGKNVLMGRFVLINDHGHGDTSFLDSAIPPFERELSSKGGITIGDNVWIGDKVSILSGVTIGEGAIIGANSVVTSDVPPHSFAAGCPARVITPPAN